MAHLCKWAIAMWLKNSSMIFFISLKSTLRLLFRSPRRWRYLSFFMAFVVSVALVVVPAASQQPVTLRLLMAAPDVPSWRATLARDFEAANPDIHLDIVEGPNFTNLIEDLYTSAFLLGNSPYDIINMDVIWTPKFAAAGWLEDLTDEFSEEELAIFSPADVEGSRYEGRLYRIPIRSDAGMIYYRRDLLEEAGLDLPTTFADILSLSRTLQEAGAVQWGYVWQGRQYEGAAAMFVEVLQGFGGFWVDPETLEVGLDQPAAIAAVEFLLSTIQEGVSPPGVTTYIEEDTRRIFQNGNALFLRNWPYVWPLANQDDSAVQGKIGIMPLVGMPGQTGGSCLGGWGLGIAKSSAHREEALRLIRFITQPEIQKKYVLEAGYVPSIRALFNDPEIVEQYNHYPQLLEVVDRAVLRPPIAQYAQASDILQRYLSAAITRQMDPEAAMKAASGETRRLLEAGRRDRT
jgi:multiple sugar transport system substrate-binding protein